MLNQTTRPLLSVLRTLGSLLPTTGRRAKSRRRIVRPWRQDSLRSYPSVGLTPARMRSFLQAADAGNPQTQFELFGEMLQRWPRLASVEATRRLALTGLEWEVTAAPDAAPNAAQRSAAERAAEACRAALHRVDGLREVLDGLARAIGYGIAVAELVWERGQLVDIVPVPHSRLLADRDEPWRLRILTADAPTQGVPLDAFPHKWIMHQPRATLGRPFEGGLLRASVLLYIAQNLSFKDWLTYSQIAGMPLRVAQFEPGTPADDQEQLLRMLENLTTDAVAVFGKNVDLKFVESERGGQRPYQPLQDHCNTEVTILWLGQHLTTDIRSQGSRAAAEVHDRVREDLLVDDIADEAHTIRRDLLTPLVQTQFGDDVPVPHFRRSLVQSVDTKTLAETLAVAVNELGMRVPRRWVHKALGVPEPRDDEPTLTTGNKA